jgi:hypothetical protein
MGGNDKENKVVGWNVTRGDRKRSWSRYCPLYNSAVILGVLLTQLPIVGPGRWWERRTFRSKVNWKMAASNVRGLTRLEGQEKPLELVARRRGRVVRGTFTLEDG